MACRVLNYKRRTEQERTVANITNLDNKTPAIDNRAGNRAHGDEYKTGVDMTIRLMGCFLSRARTIMPIGELQSGDSPR